jgi:hypothetical protein
LINSQGNLMKSLQDSTLHILMLRSQGNLMKSLQDSTLRSQMVGPLQRSPAFTTAIFS